jgi:hypothetical protein
MANVEDPFAMSNVLSTAGLLAIIINSLIVVRYGRRRVLLMTGLMICGVLQLIIAVVFQEQPGTTSTGKTIVALSCIYMFSYNGKIPPGTLRVASRSGFSTNGSRYDCHIRLALRRRDPIPATAKPHFWLCCRHWICRRLVDSIYCAVFY